MKYLSLTYTLAALSLISLNSYSFSINPDKVEYHQFKTHRTPKIKNGHVRVTGIKHTPEADEKYSDSGRKFLIPLKVFQRANQLSKSVFRATPGDSNGYGTAFYVGGNLVLTNQHVLSTSRDNTTECKSFKVEVHTEKTGGFFSRLTHTNPRLKCEKVHFCSKKLDFCLIQVQGQDKKGKAKLKDYRPLKLVKNSYYDENMRTMAIGNPMGFGIHASTGIGTKVKGNQTDYTPRFMFYAPVFGGNSGGPIFNDDNEVIGITVSQSYLLEGKKAYNSGIPMETVLNILEQKLKDKPEILKQLNY